MEKSGSISFGLEKRSAAGFSRRLGRSTVGAENPDGGLDYAAGSISHQRSEKRPVKILRGALELRHLVEPPFLQQAYGARVQFPVT